MSNIDIQTNGTNTIVIDDKSNDLVTITITSEDVTLQNSHCSSTTYKVSPEGKILNNIVETKIDEKIEQPTDKNYKKMLIEKMIKDGFEQVPKGLTESELSTIIEFSLKEIEKRNDYSKMFPFSVEITSSGNLKIILLMYNGSNSEIPLTKFPFKLKDAKDKLVIVDLIEINKTVSPSKIAICEVEIERARLSEQTPDLTTWAVTFEIG
ncbi:SLAP domain-containing protein [Clostridium sp.]|uniref:SLAP domain-containing protein n=1 Tax=Clostridium sp. TaxID=1506 RepID=UPI003D6CDCB0